MPDSMGGIQQVIHQIASGALKHGVESHVLSLSDKLTESQNYCGYQVHFAKTNIELASTRFSLEAFKKFKKLADEADIIHYQYPWPFMDLVHFVTRCKKPTLVSYQSDIIKQKNLFKLYRPLQKRFLNSVDRIVFSSPSYLETSTQIEPFKNKAEVIPIGLDKSNYPISNPELNQQWLNKLGNRFFLFVGVLRYYKGLHILIEAAKNTSYPIVILGSGPIEEELKAQAQSLNIQNIHFLGFLSDEDKASLLEVCTAVVFPSHLRSEAFGISLLEGAMYGKPMISCEIGTGTSYINIDKETGLVVQPNNPLEFRQAMDWVWNNPEQAEQMGKNAFNRYQEVFTTDKMVESYVEIYKDLLKNK